MKKQPDVTKSVRKLIVEEATAGEEIQKLKVLIEDLEENVHVGTRIKNLREDIGISQDYLASNTGLSQSYISRIEKGEATPSKEALERITVPLKTHLTTLVDGTTSASALEEPTLAQRYAYCPNIDCPKTVYRFTGPFNIWLYSVEKLWERFHVWSHMPPGALKEESDEIQNILIPDRLPPKDLRKERKDCEIVYRWVPVDESTVFCEECGKKLRNDCPICEVPLKVRDQKFCHKCGKQLNKPPEQDEGGEK